MEGERHNDAPQRRRGAGAGDAARPGGSSPRLGRLGEQHAADHLERLGFAILARNARTAAGELDLVAFDAHTLVFAEVKTTRARSRSDPARGGGGPLTRLGAAQRTRVRRLAAAWLRDPANARPYALELRFDAIAVVVDRGGALLSLEHLENAW